MKPNLIPIVMIEEWNSGKEARTRVGMEEFGEEQLNDSTKLFICYQFHNRLILCSVLITTQPVVHSLLTPLWADDSRVGPPYTATDSTTHFLHLNVFTRANLRCSKYSHHDTSLGAKKPCKMVNFIEEHKLLLSQLMKMVGIWPIEIELGLGTTMHIWAPKHHVGKKGIIPLEPVCLHRWCQDDED
jgi:hypothetical protein